MNTLTFNPLKLVLLIGWVYLCLYFVQSVQFSPLVPKNRKTIAGIAALFAGPILFFVLTVADVISKSSESHRSFLEIIKENIPGKSAIKLVDSAGRNIKAIYGGGKSRQENKPILNLTKQIIGNALEERASDILIEPKDKSTYTIRLRIDGTLWEVDQIEADTCKAVIDSIKAVSNMDISEKRRPQDGAFVAKTADGTVPFRVASAGVLNGEKLSVRVLASSADLFTLDNIGLSKKQQVITKNAMSKPCGMILICGPIGSGRSATLYAMLNNIDLFTRNVFTLEDPIVCSLPNITQIEVNPKAGVTFANSLRTVLRQDPDVICVDEIRDEETAGIALRAAKNDQLVLATIHSNSTASALIRLIDLGASPLTLSSCLNLIISQRLVRQLCSKCKVPAELSQSQIHDFHKRSINYRNFFHAQGCDNCHETGYYGRTAIFDILVLDDKLKASIANEKLSVEQLRKEGDKRGKSNLQKQGLLKAVSGITSLEELKRVLG